MDRPIQIYFRGRMTSIQGVSATRTVLQWLREDVFALGSKEGCAEGDCGACTVVVGTLDPSAPGGISLHATNSCIQLLGTLDGKALFTVEDVAQGRVLHPIQQAMVQCHGSQCGFCTPGFVMSLWADYESRAECPTREETLDVLSGNLCRCTGYRPILDAVRAARLLPRPPFDPVLARAVLDGLAKLSPLLYSHAGEHFWAPHTLDEALSLRAQHPNAILVGGSTDVGLWVTKQLRCMTEVIYLGRIESLRAVDDGPNHLEIGAAATLTDAFEALAKDDVHWRELARRFASVPVRNAATLGGNIANGSPIGDSMPGLLVLDSSVVLQSITALREIALNDFYLGYRRTSLLPSELVRAIRVPKPDSRLTRLFRTWKVAKRYDQDISAVCGAFRLDLTPDGAISHARVAFGGMAAIPKRAPACESILTGRLWNDATAREAMLALAQDYQPLSDMRATQGYRMQVAQNLLRRFHLETGVDRPECMVRLPLPSAVTVTMPPGESISNVQTMS